MPPAFVLSQDQTLMLFLYFYITCISTDEFFSLWVRLTWSTSLTFPVHSHVNVFCSRYPYTFFVSAIQFSIDLFASPSAPLLFCFASTTACPYLLHIYPPLSQHLFLSFLFFFSLILFSREKLSINTLKNNKTRHKYRSIKIRHNKSYYNLHLILIVH